MKKLVLAVAALAVLGSCGHKNTPPEQVLSQPIASTLVERLQQLHHDSLIAIGHHDDPAYGHSWAYMADSSDVKNVTGDYPAIFDWDLGLIEWQTEAQLDGVPFEFIRETVAKHAADGGINTFSWHVRNPVSHGDAWDINAGEVIKTALTDEAVGDTLRTWMGRVAEFIGSLTDSTGTRIPVVFRPWHENTGSWFWWGEKFCTPEEYKALWRMTREVFDQKGIDNVVWAYSPGSEPNSIEKFEERYPGNELVDIVGFDTYYFGGPENKDTWQEKTRQMLDVVTEFAAQHGKVPVMAETGYESIPMADWYTEVLYPVIKDYPIAYVVFWRNAHDKPNHYYTPYPGHPAAEDFVQFYNLPQTIFLNDLKK